MGRKKSLKSPSPNTGTVIPDSTREVANDELPPLFSLEYLAKENRYSLENCQQIEQSSLIKMLCKLSKFSWREIKTTANKHGLGYEIVRADKMKVQLPSDITSDVTFLVFRFAKKKGRMIGYRDRRIFYIVFLDRNHDLF